MEPKRYWWMQYKSATSDQVQETCEDIHPFLWIHTKTEEYNNRPVPTAFQRLLGSYKLVNWKLITDTEYNLWQELNNNQ